MAGFELFVPLDVGYFRHPRSLAAGPEGRMLHLASLCWAKAHRTDGHVEPAAIPTLLLDAGARKSAVDALERAGLWVPNGSGFEISGYLDRNMSRAEIAEQSERNRAAGRERQARWRAQREGGDDAG